MSYVPQKKSVIQVLNDMRVSKWWQMFSFGWIIPIKFFFFRLLSDYNVTARSLWGEQETETKATKTLKSKEKLQRKSKKKEKVCLCMTNLWNQLEPKRYSNHTEKSQKPAKRGLEKGGEPNSEWDYVRGYN